MVPLLVVMLMGPVAAVPGTLKERVFGLIVPKLVTAAPPTVTEGLGDFSFNPAPATVTKVPDGPKFGEKE